MPDAQRQMPPLALLSSMAHAVGKPSFESLTTEQRLSALNAALLVMVNEKLATVTHQNEERRRSGR